MSDSGTERLMRISSLAVILLLLLFVSCENNPLDAIDTQGSAPYLHSAAVSPAGFDLDAMTQGTSYPLYAALTATVRDPQGASDVAAVTYVLFDPSGDSQVASGKCAIIMPPTQSEPVIGTGTFSFSVDAGATGNYRLEISAVDQAGHMSATFVQEIPVFRGKSAPFLSLPGARLLAESGADSIRYALSISATDGNGLGDISKVTVRAVGAKDDTPRTMYDDGGKLHADAVAGDGTYSLPLWVAPLGDIHDVVFEFSAEDRAGHPSNIARRPVANAVPRFITLDVPSTIQRPASGASTVTFRVTVTDDDGLPDIDSVYFRNMSTANPVPFPLYDDGNLQTHGDSTALDGSYASILEISSSNSPGVKAFRFSVTDRFGARADTTRNITIN